MSTHDVIKRAFASILKPKPRRTVSEHADLFRYVGTGAEKGPWRTSRTPYLREIMDSASDPSVERVTMMCSAQIGKALCVDTPIPTLDGWTTMGALRVGDRVFDENGKPCTVTFATEFMYDRECFDVEFSDGQVIRADAEHRWLVDSYLPIRYEGKFKKGVYRDVLTTRDMLSNFKIEYADGKSRNNYSIPVAGALETPEASLPIRPYTLGVWLGDGHTASNRFFGHEDDLEIVDRVRADGYVVEVELDQGVSGKGYTAVIDPFKRGSECKRGHDMDVTGRTKQGYCAQCSREYALKHKWKDESRMSPIVARKSFGTMLRELELHKGKHIPESYLRASIEQRFALLQGVMDTDGTAGKNGRCSITLKSERLSDGVSELLSSLGIKHSRRVRMVTCTNGEGKPKSEVHVIDFMAYSDQPIFRMERKQARLKDRASGRSSETTTRWIVDIRPVESVPVRCIQVDSPSHLFLAGHGMVPTHNTETLLNILQYYVEADPSPIVFVQPTIEAAEDFAKERLEPMIDHTPGLAEKLAEKAPTLNKVSRKKQSETLRMKHYPGGFLALVGSNSPAGLASRAARIGILDEYDRMVNNREGDPLAQLETRTITFSGNRKIVAVSTPLDKETSKIYKQFKQGDQRKLHIPCPHCGAESVWTFDDIYWDNDEQGLAIPHTIRHVCPHCKETIRGNAKAPDDLLAEGRWIPERPEIKDHRSYHVWTMHSPMVPLGEIVRLYQEADRSKDPVKRKEFVNRVLGEPYEATNVDDRLHRKLFKRREEYTAEVPDGVGLLTCGVDVQGSFLVSEVVGWGAGKESWGIEYRLWPGDPKQPRVWENLREYLRKPFRFSNGVEIQIACTFIDSGGHNTQDVYRFTRSMLEERVYAIKGVSRPGVPYVGKPSIVGTEQTILYNLGVDEGKTRIMAWANETDVGPGYCHWPDDPAKGYDEHYFRGLISERYEPIKKGDKVVYQWVQNYDRNEPLDVRNYATAAMELLNPDLDEWVSYYASLSPTESIVQESRPSGQLSKGIRL